MKRIPIALSVVSFALLAALSACAGLLGIDEPNVVADGTLDGDAKSTPGEGGTSGDGSSLGDGGTGRDAAGTFDASPLPPTSCSAPSGVASNCGPTASDSCCASLAVSGGTFNRDDDPTAPATVSTFRLDKYEVTVGRFRLFVAAAIAGWNPPLGSGKHVHLNGGNGLNGGTESGWTADVQFTTIRSTWDVNLNCDGYATWTSSPAANENRPINCINWYEAEAFCIWDAAFLPTEAEWAYAASGGAGEHAYPWSVPAASTTVDCSYANFGGTSWPSTACVEAGTNKVGTDSPKGDGVQFGHTDLAGNVSEWVLDYFVTPYTTPCNDCVQSVPANGVGPIYRGGAFLDPAATLLTTNRQGNDKFSRLSSAGVRCARVPP